MGTPHTRAGRARGRESAARGSARARNLAIPAPDVSPPPITRIRAMAHAYRLRRPRRSAAGEGRGAVRTLGGKVAVIAPVGRPRALEERIKAQAFGLGFDLAGIARLGPAETASAFDEWLARGYAGDMHYLPRWADKRRDTRLPLAGVTSAIVVAMNYGGTAASGPVARYA